MSQDRTRRFDDTFKILLTIYTVSFSASLALFRDLMGSEFFFLTIAILVITIGLWAIFNLGGGNYEYVGKIIAWYFLMIAFGLFFLRLYYLVIVIPPIVEIFLFLLCFGLTVAIKNYLKEVINEVGKLFLNVCLPLVTLAIIIFDVLVILGKIPPIIHVFS